MELILGLIVGIPLLSLFLHRWMRRREQNVLQYGMDVSATVVDVRVDEGECIVRYRFVDPHTGKVYERSGVLGFHMDQPPQQGELIAVRFLPRSPRWSRMVDEIQLTHK